MAAAIVGLLAFGMLGILLPRTLSRSSQGGGPPASNRAGPVVPTSPSASPTQERQSFANLFSLVSSGVVRLDATSCDGGGVGTGFLIDRTLVVTVAHVIENATNIAVSSDSDTTTGYVIGEDDAQDVALIRLAQGLSGHTLEFADEPPDVGAPIAAIGFPLGLPIAFTEGVVSAIHRAYPDPAFTQSDLIQTDTAFNHGNSGGPVIDELGRVVGLVDLLGPEGSTGISYAVSAQTAKPLVDRWKTSPARVKAPTCSDPVGPPAEPPLDPPPVTDGEAIASALATYFAAINARDYLTAWEQYTPQERQRITVAHLADADATSYAFDFRIVSANYGSDNDTAFVFLTFTSIQDASKGPNGDVCTNWSLDYTMRRIGELWLIDRALPHSGSGHTSC